LAAGSSQQRLLIVTALLVVVGIALPDRSRGRTRAESTRSPEDALTIMLTRVNMPFSLLIAIAAAFMAC